MRILTAILIALLAAFVLARAFPARAHFDYAWINDGGYKAADGSHCCGAADCVEVKPGEIAEAPGGVSTPWGAVHGRGVYPSRDGKAWVCRRHFRHSTARSSCAFVPGGG